jgi:hypothetical protein
MPSVLAKHLVGAAGSTAPNRHLNFYETRDNLDCTH